MKYKVLSTRFIDGQDALLLRGRLWLDWDEAVKLADSWAQGLGEAGFYVLAGRRAVDDPDETRVMIWVTVEPHIDV